MNSNPQGQAMKVVFTIVDRAPNKSFWTRVGVGFVNRDGSLSLRLDAIPTNGLLHVRDYDEARDTPRWQGEGTPPARTRSRAEGSEPQHRSDAQGGLA